MAAKGVYIAPTPRDSHWQQMPKKCFNGHMKNTHVKQYISDNQTFQRVHLHGAPLTANCNTFQRLADITIYSSDSDAHIF